MVALDNEECRDFITTLWDRVGVTQIDITSTPFIQIRIREAKDNVVVWATSDGIEIEKPDKTYGAVIADIMSTI